MRPVRLRQKPKAPGSRFPHRRSKSFRSFVKAHDCAVATHATRPRPCFALPGRTKIECAHLKTQGSGGDDVGNCVPLCPTHHDEQEGFTEAFERKFGLDLHRIASTLQRQWEEGHDDGDA